MRPITLVKLGGAVLADPMAVGAVWDGVADLRAAGTPVVVVHGGGPQQTEIAARLGHTPRLVAGRRVTGDLDLRIALWTLRGEINAGLVAAGVARGVPAAGISGADGPTVVVTRRPSQDVDGETVDFGHVGDVVRVETDLIRALLAAGIVPVVAPVSTDARGGLFNVNADTVAMEIAAALGAGRLVFVAEAGGVFRDLADPASRLAHLSTTEAAAGVVAGWIADGMRPKLDTGFAALARGVAAVRICAPGALADDTLGTRLLPA
ncbi:MAG TPA: acetylglutamate kinase [Rubricoccaceae bacterium]